MDRFWILSLRLVGSHKFQTIEIEVFTKKDKYHINSLSFINKGLKISNQKIFSIFINKTK